MNKQALEEANADLGQKEPPKLSIWVKIMLVIVIAFFIMLLLIILYNIFFGYRHEPTYPFIPVPGRIMSASIIGSLLAEVLINADQISPMYSVFSRRDLAQ